MIITDAEVLVSRAGRNFVTVRLRTADGVVGLGDATLAGREEAVIANLREHVLPLLIGRDAHRIEDTWQLLYRGGYWRRGAVAMTSIAAIDVALWDIKAKVAGLPLYQLLGGASRDGCLAYGHASGRDIPELLDAVRAQLDEGYRAIRIQSAVPGLATAYGLRSLERAAEHGEGIDRPVVEEWDTTAYLRHIPDAFEAVRTEFGASLPLLHDAHHRLTPTEAIRLARSLEPYDLFWLEDVTPAENTAVLRRIRAGSSIPLAIGEVFDTIWDYRPLIEEQLIDFVRSPVTRAGGITGLRRIYDYAAVYQIKSGVQGPGDISPVGLAAALHLGIAIHNFGIQEYMMHPSEAHDLFRTSFRWAEGMLHPGDQPGLGVDYDDEFAAAHPAGPHFHLPLNRLSDGTLHDW